MRIRTFDHLTLSDLKLERLLPIDTAIELLPCDTSAMSYGITLFELNTVSKSSYHL